MKKNIKYLIEFIVNSNIWIALATVSFYELTLFQIQLTPRIESTSVFLFFSTLFIYNFFRILSPKEECKTWYANHYFYTTQITFLAFIGTLVSFYYFDKTHVYLILLATFLSFIYANPLRRINVNFFNLRKYWFLKSIIVALVWIILTVVLPIKQNGLIIEDFSLFAFEKFLFILSITIPYDIKDVDIDTFDGVKTFAIKFGINMTKLISYFFLMISYLIAIYLFSNTVISITLVYFITFVLISILNERSNELWYTFLIDGTIILYFLFVFILNN